jgi:hypothetical protein
MIRKIINLPLVIFIFTLASCSKDFLETVPTDAVTPAVALADEAGMQNILNGIHRGMYSQTQTFLPGGNTARAGDHYWVPMGDNLTGGIIHSADANNLGWRNTMQWNDHTVETSLTNEILWYHRYNIILHANMIIERINEGDLTETPDLLTIKGQAYTYRAFAFLSLVQHFSKGYLIGNPSTDPGVPVILKPQTTGPRGTVQDVYTQIGLDLEEAINAFKNGSTRPTGGPETKSQLNINVAYGVKARWALSKGDWQVAADAAVEARKGFPLMNEADWKSGFNTNSLSEVIWGSNVVSTETTFFRSYFYLASNTFNGSQIRNNPKIADRRLVDAIPSTDYRKDVFLPDAPNSNSSASNQEGGWTNNTNPLYSTEAEFDAAISNIKSTYGLVSGHNTHPYMHFKLKQKNPGSIDPDDIIYMRSAEMYLIEAEANAMKGPNGIADAQNALQAIAGTRDTAFDATVFATQADLMKEIKFQRRLELWGEGFGYTDHIRWDEAVDHSSDGGSGASEILYQDAYKIEKPSTNDDWIFKIPQAEINANPHITPEDQNK